MSGYSNIISSSLIVFLLSRIPAKNTKEKQLTIFLAKND